MKTKSIFKYIFIQDLRGYAIFACVLLVVMHLFLSICLFTDSSGGLGGMESSTIIFISIIGIATYKENFKMSVQNGVSRKSFYVGNILSCFAVAFMAACGDLLYVLLGRFYSGNIENFQFNCLYEQLYADGGMTNSMIPKVLMFYLSIYMMLIFIGVFIGALLNRLSKVLKIAIPVGLYLLVVLIGFIDTVMLDSLILSKLADVFLWFSKDSMNLVYVCPVIAVLFAAGGFLFARRMAVNDKM